ncbi:MAG: indolepyruvate ferredoxin oxidoreductase family protein [Anaerolineae bacterium]
MLKETHPLSKHLSEFSLLDKFTKEEGTILLTGIHALVRLPMDQHRADQRRGLHTATFISGYRGSPLGGLDITLNQYQKLLTDYHVVFQPGVNEELGATAVFGSQVANLLPQPKYDGVLGVWYGKAPGVDRSGDIFKHANFAGVGKHGGVLAIAGDDPISKSSTIPSHSEVTFWDANFPTLYPGNVQEILDMGRLGFELSRYTGLWTGFKIVTNVADEFSTAFVSPNRGIVEDPGFIYNGKPWQHNQNTNLLTPFSLTMEREIQEGRLEAARYFARANGVNTITVPTRNAWLGIITAGKTYYETRQALNEIGLTEAKLHEYGIRLLKIGMLYPVEPDIVHEFAQGLEEILVIEEKRAFLELFIRDILYHLPDRPRIVGKRDEDNNWLTPAHGELDADSIAAILAKRLQKRLDLPSISSRMTIINTPPQAEIIPLLARTPFFCSGCPHNSSTVAPEGALVAAGIGCHTMTILMPGREVIGMTQMGGEGAQWVGASPFTEINHIFQNLGDGTFFHSGSLAIRQSIAANVNITYKILFNSAVAMTGGQPLDGEITVPSMAALLKAEGVKKIIVTTDDLGRYGFDQAWPEGVEVWHRDRLDEAQQVLSGIPGVTVLIHDQECAAELRRKRRRGLAPEPETRVFINEDVCEGCGDCGVKSNCLSVIPVDTEFGRKTQIHQSSCNKDYSCLKGDCPAFITIIPGEKQTQVFPGYTDDFALPVPQITREQSEFNLYMMGIGGTGVVTTNQIIATAAAIDDKHVIGLDQTGLSQKGGPVVSHLKILESYEPTGNMVSKGKADCYLVLDLLTATDHNNMTRTHADRTVAVISTSEVATGSMVISTDVRYPRLPSLLDTLYRNTRQNDNITFDAVLVSETLFGSHMPTNIMMVGAAYQAGLVPLSAAAIERAIELNGVSVETNKQAFRVGRRIVADPDYMLTIHPKRMGALPIPKAADTVTEHLLSGIDGELYNLMTVRVPELIAYQNKRYAQQYVNFVRQVRAVEENVMPGHTALSEAVARYLYKLMAYKDEYEVARLHTKATVHQVIEEEFGEKAKVHYMLHPPLLRAMGLNRKLKLGAWFNPVFALLVRMKALRGTPFDIFGYDHVRRVERQLISDYRALIEQALSRLTPEDYERAVNLANLPEVIRGYEKIKLSNVEKFWRDVEYLGFQKPS